MAEPTGTLVPPNLNTPDDYRDFMRSEAGSELQPGSDEEKLVMAGFKAARQKEAIVNTQEAVGTSEQPGPLQEELKSLEQANGGYVSPEASQAVHHSGEITITKAEGQDGAMVPVTHTPGPLEVNNNPETGIIDASKLPQQSQPLQAASLEGSLTPDINPKAPGANQPPQRI